MPDAAFRVHPPPFDYQHRVFRAAASEEKARSRGRCRLCGRKAPLQAHHWGRPPYPPPHETTAADLTALCPYCHITAHLGIFFESAGGSPETFCAALSETMATLLLRGTLPASPMRVGRPVWAEGWAALVTGRLRPHVGEIFALFLRSREGWQAVAVTKVLDGQPGCWRVRKRFLGNNGACFGTVPTEQSVPTATGQAAA